MRFHLSIVLFVILLSLSSLVSNVRSEVIVWDPPEIAGTYDSCILNFNQEPLASLPPPLNGTLVTFEYPNYTNNIVLAPRLFASILDWNLFYFQSTLPKAVLLMPTGLWTPGLDEFDADCWSCLEDQIVVPFVDVNLLDGLYILSVLNGNLTSNVTVIYTPNPWETFNSSAGWIISQIIVVVAYFFGIVFACVKLIMFWKNLGFQPSIAQVTLIIIIMGLCGKEKKKQTKKKKKS